MNRITTLGELLVDFTPAGQSERGHALFETNPGGGVANLAVAAAKAGLSVSFIGKVGDDVFGHLLSDSMASYGVDVRGIRFSREYLTTLAFVYLFPNGDRDFAFYRRPGPDAMLSWEDIDTTLMDEAELMHVSALSMTTPVGKATTLRAVAYMRAQHKPVSYDPNWRPTLWPDAATGRSAMYEMLPQADIVKMSEEELALITGIADEAEAVAHTLSLGPRVVFITRGERGASWYCAKGRGDVAPVQVKAVDATGAGDCIFGNTLAKMLQCGIDLDDIDTAELDACLRYGNAAAAVCVQHKGGMPSMPTPAEVG